MTACVARTTLEPVETLNDIAALERFQPNAGEIVLIPTMGALHSGHESLIRYGASLASARRGTCIVWIFVNPTQFNDPADYARYPKTLDSDLSICRRAGAGAVFVPSKEEIYPSGIEIRVPELPRVATKPGLEDAKRPGHFAGVCQVVLRFFELVKPNVAVFGEKDWQQLQVVRAMAAREMPRVEILAMPTVREEDGLAMSSRNRFLSAEDRVRALALSRALRGAGSESSPRAAEQSMSSVLLQAGVEPEYAVVRDAATLEQPGDGPKRALIAARVGSVRLIDNAEWPAQG
ncbi:MAG: pantoate--beta-alanine ligase [Phycisphaeraceae bacterium]|nr:pantoate--beta-alanine ligase [Phycisphaeraceae bacterium]